MSTFIVIFYVVVLPAAAVIALLQIAGLRKELRHTHDEFYNFVGNVRAKAERDGRTDGAMISSHDDRIGRLELEAGRIDYTLAWAASRLIEVEGPHAMEEGAKTLNHLGYDYFDGGRGIANKGIDESGWGRNYLLQQATMDNWNKLHAKVLAEMTANCLRFNIEERRTTALGKAFHLRSPREQQDIEANSGSECRDELLEDDV